MKKIGVTQRVDVIESYQERRDALDQQWNKFLLRCGLLPILFPNNKEAVEACLQYEQFDGFLFTGGNSLIKYGGNAPERDDMETFLIEYALQKKIPIMGVCRGMQLIQEYFDVILEPVSGQVCKEATIFLQDGSRQLVNSYHDWGTTSSNDELKIWARSEEGIVKALKHSTEPILGVMWHPERIYDFRKEDISLFSKFFGGKVI